MNDSGDPQRFRFEDGSFLALVLIVTVAFALVIAPFFGAILWGLVLALMFSPVHRHIRDRMPERPTIAALLTLLIIVLIVILPAVILGSALIQEFLNVYAMVQSGQIDIARIFEQMTAALPDWAGNWLQSNGWTDLADARQQISQALSGSFSAIATHALQVGQGALNLILMIGVMLYLTFFLIRDGESLAHRVIESIPLDSDRRRAVVRNFTLVTRATIKGSLIVAIVQGTVGGITFALLGIEGALLWGTLMAIFSLIPAIGCGIVWLPVSLYLFATGAMVKGAILVAAGALVIGSIDNVLRPILVGRETRMPDYVVLISTLGGLQLFGFHGFIVGPVVAALFIGTWDIVTEQRRASKRR